MSKQNGNGKPLRFAAFIRVSTEKQAKRGESLRTQAMQIENAVRSYGGELVKKYAGQEHGTAGWERTQLDQLLADAQKKPRPFDAVMVADLSRWSRDNQKSKEGLGILRHARIRFFALSSEFDIFSPQAKLTIGLTTEFNEFSAANQMEKSLWNRIERARCGTPTGGKLPFGRQYDKATNRWSVDPDKQAALEDIAERYLAGESMPKLAKEYGHNHSHLCKVLRERCGDKWTMEFRADDLAIHETITIDIPRLLPEKTIKAVRQRLEANRTYLHGKPTYDYLLSGRVFCATCGYGFFGQNNKRNGHDRLYYRHAHLDRDRPCPHDPKPWVPCDRLEPYVVSQLFDLMGNPAAIERAVKAATPDCEKLLKRRDRLTEDLEKIVKARGRILSLIEKDAITDDDAESKLLGLKERGSQIQEKLESLAESLANVPDASTIRCYVEEIGGSIFVLDDDGNTYAGGNDVQSRVTMTRDEERQLIDAAFSVPCLDGSPAGVYITPLGGPRYGTKKFKLELRGRLLPRVTPRALPLSGKGLPESHCRGGTLRSRA